MRMADDLGHPITPALLNLVQYYTTLTQAFEILPAWSFTSSQQSDDIPCALSVQPFDMMLPAPQHTP